MLCPNRMQRADKNRIFFQITRKARGPPNIPCEAPEICGWHSSRLQRIQDRKVEARNLVHLASSLQECMCVLLKVQGDGIAKEIDKTSDLKREKHRTCDKIWQLKLR